MSNIYLVKGNLTLTSQPDEDIVEMLERYLKEAKEGNISGLAIAVARPSDTIANAFWYGSSGHTLTAAVSGLFYRVNKHADES